MGYEIEFSSFERKMSLIVFGKTITGEVQKVISIIIAITHNKEKFLQLIVNRTFLVE